MGHKRKKVTSKYCSYPIFYDSNVCYGYQLQYLPNVCVKY